MSTSAGHMSHDKLALRPKTDIAAPDIAFDWPALRIGIAEYDEGPTGCTVFHFPEGVSAAVDKRGGMVGAIEIDYGWYHAVCFAGGSLLGLEAALGVRSELLAGTGYNVRQMPMVSGAIIWDWEGRNNVIYPNAALGRAAVQSARTGRFPTGPHGAGRSAGCGASLAGLSPEPTGQGGAFKQVGDVKIAVFTVLNALGAVVDRQGQVVRGHLDRATCERHRHADRIGHGPERRMEEGRNTTLTLVATNQKLENWWLTQLSRQVHSSMARAIQPFHTRFDGDILYAVTTNEVEDDTLTDTAMGVLASELAWDAVLAAAGHGASQSHQRVP